MYESTAIEATDVPLFACEVTVPLLSVGLTKEAPIVKVPENTDLIFSSVAFAACNKLAKLSLTVIWNSVEPNKEVRSLIFVSTPFKKSTRLKLLLISSNSGVT